MEIASRARFIKTAPDKIRILVAMIKNQKIDQAISKLKFSNKVGAKAIIFVLQQAKGQIKDKNMVEDNFSIKAIKVDEGPKLKRRRIVHQGRATAILKRMAHITVVLSDEPKSKIKSQKSKLDNKSEKSLEIKNSKLKIGATRGATHGSKS